MSLYYSLSHFGFVSEHCIPFSYVKPPPVAEKCTMNSCFDFTRCIVKSGEKVPIYIYPEMDTHLPQWIDPVTMFNPQEVIIQAVRSTPWVREVTNPQDACLLFPNLRDGYGLGWVRPNSDRAILRKQLPYWNSGRNHVLFELSDMEVPGFDPENAIVIRSNCRRYYCRDGFDIPIPFYARAWVDERTHNVTQYGGVRKYLLSFKGSRNRLKKYRNRLFPIHNGVDIIIAAQCTEDGLITLVERQQCERDAALYAQYEFEDLVLNSTFSLVPEGYGVHTSRLTEVMQGASIPVMVNDDLISPLADLVDWTQLSFTVPVGMIERVPDILRAVPPQRVLQMQQRVRDVYLRYMQTPRHVFQAGMEVLRKRIFSIAP